MLIYVIAIAVAVLIVPLTGGRFPWLARLHMTRVWLLFAGLAIQIALDYVDLPRARLDDLGFALLLLSYVLVLGFAISNLRVPGMGVITIGIAMNAFVIALNLGMPYTVPAGVRPERPTTTVKHHLQRSDDVLTVLSDRIALGDPFDVAISFGDLVISVGLVDLVYRASRRPRALRARHPHPSAGVDIDLAEYERLAAARHRPIPEHDPFEGIEDPRVVDVARP